MDTPGQILWIRGSAGGSFSILRIWSLSHTNFRTLWYTMYTEPTFIFAIEREVFDLWHHFNWPHVFARYHFTRNMMKFTANKNHIDFSLCSIAINNSLIHLNIYLLLEIFRYNSNPIDKK